MKISIKHNNNRDSFVCLPSPNIPPPRNFAIHPVCHIEYILFRCKISSLSFLEFALCTSCLFHTKREILLCQEVLRCNDKLFLLWRSSHNTEKCTPWLLPAAVAQVLKLHDHQPAPTPGSSHPSLPSNFPSSSVWASLSTINPDVLSALFAP